MNELEKSNWWYRGRRIIVSMLFQKYFKNKTAILDIGCGTGEGIAIVPNETTLTGLDISEIALSFAKEKKYSALYLGTAETTPFEDDSFDGILMLDVLEHTEDDTKTLAECFRVLKPLGNIILTVPAYQWLWSGHDEVFGHKRRYIKDKLVSRVQDASLEIVFVSYYMTFLFPIIALFRLTEKKIRNKKTSHFFYIPNVLNKILLLFPFLEGIFLRLGIKFPFGSSIILIARKK